MTEDQTGFVLQALSTDVISSYRSLKNAIFRRKIRLSNNI
jgi:hypothetical protein